jgi:hypothetical protein
MPFANTAGWPDEILGIVENSKTVEYASLTRAGVPITFPMLLFIGEDGLTLDVSTALTFPAKAQRARNNPKVCLLFSDPLGCGLDSPPVVLVYGLATVRDADLQANTDRFVNLVFQRFSDVYGQFPSILLKKMAWYFTRVWIQVTPLRILWWHGGDLSREPKTWQAPKSRQVPPSDPPPTDKVLKRWDKPPTEWLTSAEHAVASLGKPVLTVVDSDGYPVPIRTQDASLEADGFQLTLCQIPPAPAQGKACLTFHQHDEKFISWQENLVFVGEVSGDVKNASFKVDRRLTSISLKGSQLQIMLDLFKLGRRFAPRLKTEARRRGQAVPAVRLPKEHKNR